MVIKEEGIPQGGAWKGSWAKGNGVRRRQEAQSGEQGRAGAQAGRKGNPW